MGTKTLEFLTPTGGGEIYAPYTQTVYEFELREGRRLAHVLEEDVPDLLKIRDGFGRPQFAVVEDLEPEPLTEEEEFRTRRVREPDEFRDQLRAQYLEKFGVPAPGRMKNDTLRSILDSSSQTESVPATVEPADTGLEPAGMEHLTVLEPAEVFEFLPEGTPR